MKEIEFHFKSQDGLPIYAVKWEADSSRDPVGIVQLVHGMSEHIGRYRRFAEALTSKGFMVFGHDHRGHGQTANREEPIYFHDSEGWEVVLSDIKILHDHIRDEYPELPCFVFGHSMGSFLTKTYIQRYGADLSGVVLSGTGFTPKWFGRLSVWLAERDVKKVGAMGLSQTLAPMVSKQYNKRFKPNRTESDWLSRDQKEVDRFIEDPDCGRPLTAGFYRDMLQGMSKMDDRSKCALIPNQLPVLLIAGDQDPVGNYGKAILKTRKNYEKVGIKDIDVLLYEGARHELLNETNRDHVTQDVLDWLLKKV